MFDHDHDHAPTPHHTTYGSSSLMTANIFTPYYYQSVNWEAFGGSVFRLVQRQQLIHRNDMLSVWIDDLLYFSCRFLLFMVFMGYHIIREKRYTVYKRWTRLPGIKRTTRRGRS